MARLAAFDMDGTLLMPDHHLGEKTLSTLARLRERDITLTFATGRHALEMQHILGALSLDAYLITGNGTRVHSLEGELLHRDDLPADVAELVLYQQWDTRASMHNRLCADKNATSQQRMVLPLCHGGYRNARSAGVLAHGW